LLLHREYIRLFLKIIAKSQKRLPPYGKQPLLRKNRIQVFYRMPFAYQPGF